jgi:hypothetical protein
MLLQLASYADMMAILGLKIRPTSILARILSCRILVAVRWKYRVCLDTSNIQKFLQDSPSHRIFECMHEALNIVKKITNYVNHETNLSNLISP